MAHPAAHAAQAIVSTAVITPQLAWIPLLPLASFTILILIGRRLGRLAPWISVAALASAFVLTMSLGGLIADEKIPTLTWQWLLAGKPAWSMGFSVDGLSWLMLFIVTAIGTMIQLYSIGYMHDDPRCSRFFAYLSLFCASMLGLAMANHYVLLFACWEVMGLCSYLLIGFWFEKPAPVKASRKAFMTTRVGDAGLLTGLLLLFATAGDLHFAGLGAIRDQLMASHQQGLLTLISLLIFMGAVGKSAQVPLHVWLPDAMEGPTPVSALIHAATMVAAGVYLVVRSFPLFTPQSLNVVLAIGMTTHLMAGTIALTQTDIKKVLAYSTISQLGLMFVAFGLGHPLLAMFHLTTHAFFKALLFLGAGSVIHATHEQDLAKIGGLLDSMKITGVTFLIAAISMSGVFPLSGFWSKDAILLEAQAQFPEVFWLLVLGAVMTTTYIFRLYFRVFHGSMPAAAAMQGHGGHSKVDDHGKVAGHGKHAAPSAHAGHGAPHESPLIMTVPLMVLAVGAFGAGLAGSPFFHHAFFKLLGVTELHEGLDMGMLLASLGIAGTGISLAWFVGLERRKIIPAPLLPILRPLYELAYNKYYFDEIYQAAIVQPFMAMTVALSRFDSVVIDGLVNAAGRGGRVVSEWKAAFDRQVVDRIVTGTADIAQALSRNGRRLQTGFVQHYLFGLIAAVVVIALWLK